MFFNQTIQLIYVKIYFTSMKIKYVSYALDSKKIILNVNDFVVYTIYM